MSHLMLIIAVFTFLISDSSAFSETHSEQVPVIFNGEEMLVGGFVIDKDDNIYLTQGRNGVLKGNVKSYGWEQIITSYIYQTSLDSEGSLWSLSFEKLIKYDAYNLVSYENDILSTLTSFIALPGGIIWGIGASVLQYNVFSDSITYYDESNGVPSAGNWITTTPEGEIWISHTVRYSCHLDCQYNGVSHFNGSNWEVFTTENGLLDQKVTSIVALSSTEVYISGPGGIAKYNGESLEPFNTNYDVQCLAISPDGNLWATGYRKGGFVPPYVHIKFEGNNTYEYEYNREFNSLYVTNMEIDSNGVIWESVNGHLFKHIVFSPVGVNDKQENQFPILSIAPNPFNPNTRICIYLPHTSKLHIDIYTISGQHVETIANGFFSAGNHSIHWDGSHYASGFYLCRLITSDKIVTARMCLIH